MSSVTQAPRSGRSASVSDVGRVRRENQDAILADDELGLWLVADGMGGHAGGARASAIARDTVRERVAGGTPLADAVMAAHYAIRAEQRTEQGFNDMGTTVVALAERGSEFDVCWVGDSRAYRFSRAEGRLELLTNDHNVAGVLVASGALTPDEATRHPQRHVLTDCLGLAGEDEPRVDRVSGRWQAGDLILLCSDGLSGELGDSEMERILNSCNGVSAERLVDSLLQGALSAGAHDNVSVVAVAAPEKLESARSRWKWPFGGRSR
ncbi:MAG: SpoIIE family protein phosphatase [Gammaproteobacteria bacterium]|jgi:protein phosphatase|nr:SpoIIE family protein phosphatase [Gammaproteobacteria bacterium]